MRRPRPERARESPRPAAEGSQMCGIAGFAFTRPDSGALQRLSAMTDVMGHRGGNGRAFYLQLPGITAESPIQVTSSHPDLGPLFVPPNPIDHRLELPGGLLGPPVDRTVPCTRVWLDGIGAAGTQVGLGNRRLAIVDRTGGMQPVFSEDRSVVAVFNGEIYNYRTLQKEIRSAGQHLETDTDSEVLVHLYWRLGIEETLRRLDGMYAFALWDARSACLHLARDPIGEKPLHYRVDQGQLTFASELKGLLVAPECPRDVDPLALGQYLYGESVPAPRTIYQGLLKLPPGSRLSWSAGRITTHRFFTFPSGAALSAHRGSAGAGKGDAPALEAAIEASILSRMTGEAPMGTLLSGGLDSGLVTAIMARQVSELHTFSLGFEEASFDESEPAKRAARHIGTTHHSFRLEFEAFAPLLDGVLSWMDEPLADGSLLPTAALCAWVRQAGIVVVLSGDGGDEAFGGYPTYLAHRLDPLWDLIPPRVGGWAERILNHLPSSHENIALDFKLRRIVAGFGPIPDRHSLWMCGLRPEEVFGVLSSSAQSQLKEADLWAPLHRIHDQARGASWLEAAQIHDLERYLPDDLLVKTDRAGMAFGLEIRAPLLDPELVSRGLGLPTGLKISRGQTKVALRRLGRRYLPESLLQLPKKGFGMPVAHWLRRLEPGRLEGWLEPVSGARRYFDSELVARWIGEHRSGKRDHRKRLWPLVIFERWRKGPWGPEPGGR